MTVWSLKRKKDISAMKADPQLSGFSDRVLQTLAQRGITEPVEARQFLFGNLSNLHDPSLMKDADKAASIIIDAIRTGKSIACYTDYDTDGVTSGATTTELIRHAGGNCVVWSNNRFKHGYGISPAGVDDLLAKYPDIQLIITTDNGISAHAGIDYAQSKGIPVVVTDHHDAPDTLPNAAAIVNPKRKDCPYPFKGLCGAGVAFKLMHLVYYRMGLPIDKVYATLDLVALGTVADIMPLVDENRIIVQQGFARILREDREGFKVLREQVALRDMDARSVLGFLYGPMINAVGRLDGDPLSAIELFLTTDRDYMEEVARYLVRINEERKHLTKKQTEQAEMLAEAAGIDYVNVVYDESFHEGIIGLVAGKLKEKYNRPFFVFTKAKGGVLKGSGRGISGFHLKESLDEIKELLLGYGGHEKACGLSIPEQNIDTFRSEMNRMAKEKLTDDDFIKRVRIDFAVTPDECTVDLVEEFKILEPFGEAFEQPIIGVPQFDVKNYRFMGKDENLNKHLKLQGDTMDIVVWSGADPYRDMGHPERLKLVGFPSLNVYKGKTTVQFVVNHEQIKVV